MLPYERRLHRMLTNFLSAKAIDRDTVARLLKSVYAVHHGVYAWSQDMPGLVETSSNLASIKMVDGKIKIVTSQRSSILSSRKDMSEMVRSAFQLGGAEVKTSDGYPGWKPNPSSPILKVAIESSLRNSFNTLYRLWTNQMQVGILKVLKGSRLKIEQSDGYVFSQKPPYEIISTPTMDEKVIIRGKKIAYLVDKYYNTNRCWLR